MNEIFKLINPRLLSILMLGFASGLPIALTGSTLQAWFTQAHLNLMLIGTISLISMPYAFKFLWAPLMDYCNVPVLGKRRGWMVIMQSCLVVLLLIIAQLDPTQDVNFMLFLAFCISFCSASLDISVNAYQTDLLNAQERGLGASYYVFTYRLAALLSGGLALVLANYLGWTKTYELMAFALLLTTLLSFFIPPIQEYPLSQQAFLRTIYDALIDLFTRDKIFILILFILLYKIGDAFALQLMTTFLLKGLNFSLVEVGLAYKTVTFVGTVLGALIGGVILIRWPIYTALLWFGLAQAFSNLMFIVLALVGKNLLLMITAIMIENFCSGLSTAAFFAFFMSLCNHKYTATQFALLSAVASIGRVMLGPCAAFVVQHFGWVQFYSLAFLLSFPGLICLLLLKNKVLVYAPATNN